MENTESERLGLVGIASLIIELAAAVAVSLPIWERRYRARRALEEMDAATLRDLGISRGEALHEAWKPMWRP